MGKAIGYIVALVVVLVVVYLVATGGEDEQVVEQQRQETQAAANVWSLAKMTEAAITMRETIADARTNAPEGMVPPPNYNFLTQMVLEDKGTVVRTEEAMGRGTAWVDMDGDGQPDLELRFGARPVPANIVQDTTLDLVVDLKRVDLVGDKLQLVGEAKKAEPVGSN